MGSDCTRRPLCGPLQFDRLGSRPWPPLIDNVLDRAANERFSPLTTGAGALFGRMAVYAGAYGLAVPAALGLAPRPLESSPAQESTELASHLAYGIVTDAGRRLLIKVTSP